MDVIFTATPQGYLASILNEEILSKVKIVDLSADYRIKDVATYGRYVQEKWLTNGGYVTNLLGRRYYITDSKDVYKLNNYLIQGSAADIIKACIIKIDKMLREEGYKTKLQGCIHDEICVCVAEGEHDVLYKIKDLMEHTCKTFVPLVAEIEVTTTNWAEKHEE